ncbi:MAG: hypothetical protein Q8M18_07730 [Bradyrhizobium sp.]|nr:hypothetical protein [Bradyrhizobium sp.]
MHSTLKLRDCDPHDDFAIMPDVVPTAWADKVLADITGDARIPHNVESSPDGKRPAPDQPASAASGLAAAAPTVDTTFRATVTDDIVAPVEQPPTSRWAKSAVMLVFAIGSAAAAAAWHNHGDTAKQMISNWVPGFALTSSPPTAALAEQTDAPAAQTAAAEQTAEPPAVPAQPAESPAPAAAAPSPDTLQLQSMARDLAAMAQQVEQLKASIAELKTGQQAMIREAANASEVKPAEVRPAEAKPAEVKPAASKPRPGTSARPPRTAAAPPHRPLQAYPPAPAAATAPLPQPAPMLSAPPPPHAPTRTEDGEPIVRPPMPLR